MRTVANIYFQIVLNNWCKYCFRYTTYTIIHLIKLGTSKKNVNIKYFRFHSTCKIHNNNHYDDKLLKLSYQTFDCTPDYTSYFDKTFYNLKVLPFLSKPVSNIIGRKLEKVKTIGMTMKHVILVALLTMKNGRRLHFAKLPFVAL